ncbi:MAG TPA: glycosyltransferase 87 family protein [Roseiflexaceae bacterium]|nr:glycosyltransferase 87 family protein [Roseiflexaceae bacterium]
MRRRYALYVLAVFMASFAVYMAIAWLVLAPRGYYGSRESPRFADAWIERAETILAGRLLYRDVFTTTPPLMNYLLVPPALVSQAFGHTNPWATLAFMTYFSLFNLLAAFVLLYLPREPQAGLHAAICFLCNPLTFGNALLRRQDESVLVFFFGLALLLFLHGRAWYAATAIGVTLLVKLSGSLLMPVALLRTRDWRYLGVPPLLFALGVAPFLASAGQAAVFWDVTKRDFQHPFQLGGISLGALWFRAYGDNNEAFAQALTDWHSAALLAGVTLVLLLIALRPHAPLEDLALLVTTLFVLTPKLHCGYLSLLVLLLAPLLQRHRLWVPYFLFGTLALLADFYKSPAKEYDLAIAAALGALLLMAASAVRLRLPRRIPAGAPALTQTQQL